MLPQILNQLLNDRNALFLFSAKIFFVLGSILYLIFAFVVVKQISNISKHIHTRLNPVLISFSYIHLAFSIFLIILTLTIL